MSRIRIKNFGPIKQGFKEILPDGAVNDWLDVKKVTVFIGNQGSGKSTVAKLISTFTWIEKALEKGDIDKKGVEKKDSLRSFCEYQNIDGYFIYDDLKLSELTIIDYEGEAYLFKYRNRCISVTKKDFRTYDLPKIMYVPAERNLLSVIKNAYDITGLPGALFTFAEELKKTLNALNNEIIELSINNNKFRYDEKAEISYLIGKGYELNLLQASSGLQSYVPLFLVSNKISKQVFEKDQNLVSNISVKQSLNRLTKLNEILSNINLSEKEKIIESGKLNLMYIPKCFINIVEEPEQNLFPTSQRKMLNSLLAFNNMNEGNKLIMTTHSPYLINYLTLTVKAEMVKSNLNSEDSLNKLAKIVPLESTVKSDDLVIYELNEMDGTIKKLENYKGLPSDDNELNSNLEDSNELFAQLQEIEKGWL